MAWVGHFHRRVPQFFMSSGHFRPILLWSCCCKSGWSSGLGWLAGLLKWLMLCSLMTSVTYGVLRSVWMVWLDTYHGAFTISRRIFDWARWMRSIFVLLEHPQSWTPYVHIGLMTALYNSSLLSMDKCDFLPMSQYRSLIFWSICFLFVRMCCFQLSLLSKVAASVV